MPFSWLGVFYMVLVVKSAVQVKVKVWSLATHCFKNRMNQTQTNKLQLIGMSKCYCGALWSHSLSTLMVSWTCIAACRHTTVPANHTRHSPQLLLILAPLSIGG